jgi:hypothetical protein
MVFLFAFLWVSRMFFLERDAKTEGEEKREEENGFRNVLWDAKKKKKKRWGRKCAVEREMGKKMKR